MEEMQQFRQRARHTDEAAGAEGRRQQDRTFRDGAGDNGDDSAMHPLIPAKRVNGSAVFNQAGEKIGEVEDLAVDKRSGKIAYAILSFGGFMGMGEKHQPLPWSALNYNPKLGGYVVDVTEEFLRLAPKLDTSELSGWDDSDQRDAFYNYYAALGARPYW